MPERSGTVALPVTGLCSGWCWGAVGVGGAVVGEVKQFCYLGDVLECGGGSERAIRARVGAAWGKLLIVILIPL